MAIYRKGSDPDALDRSAEMLMQSARECTAVRQAVSGVVSGLRGNWSGGDLQALASRWPAIEHQLDGFGVHLQALSAKLTQNAAAQRGASGEGGSGTYLPLGPGGPLGSGGTAGAPGSASFRDILEKFGLWPDGDQGRLMWPLFATSGLLTGLGIGASWMQRVSLGGWHPRGPGGQFVTRPTGAWSRAWSMAHGNNWSAHSGQAGSYARWGTAGRWAGYAGTALSFGTSAFGQWQADAADPDMGTTERVARAGTAGVTTAAGSWGGAWAGAQGGAMIGAAVGGPVGAVIGGAIGGLIGGGVGGMVGDWVGQQIVGPVGDFADWAGEGIGDAAEEVGDFATDVGDAITFWD